MEYGSIESRTAFVLANVDDNGTFETAEWQLGGEHYEKLKDMKTYSVMQCDGWLNEGDVEREILEVKHKFERMLNTRRYDINDHEIMKSLVQSLDNYDFELHTLASSIRFIGDNEYPTNMITVEWAELAEANDLVTQVFLEDDEHGWAITRHGMKVLSEVAEQTNCYFVLLEAPIKQLTLEELVNNCRSTNGKPSF
jgi:hypothetical protein